MMVFDQRGPRNAEGRYVMVRPYEPDVATISRQSSPIEAIALFPLRERDKVDFQVDFTDWLQANGSPSITACTYVVASESPKTPVIEGQAFSAGGKTVVVLSAAADASPGDTYYLDVTVTLAATTAASSSEVAIPARNLTRRVHVVVVAG